MLGYTRAACEGASPAFPRAEMVGTIVGYGFLALYPTSPHPLGHSALLLLFGAKRLPGDRAIARHTGMREFKDSVTDSGGQKSEAVASALPPPVPTAQAPVAATPVAAPPPSAGLDAGREAEPVS